MRSLNFRDNVLWAIAYKMGIDPTLELLTDEARALSSYINSWVRRLWDAADWPEWTIIAAFVPVNHVVPYTALFGLSTGTDTIGRVFKVYLVDPRTTPNYAAFDTPFRLQQNGVHVGLEHGTTVWIKYIAAAPRFTTDVWDGTRIYKRDEVTYLAESGECYKSKSNGNRNHNPAGDGNTTELTTEQTGNMTSDNPGVPGRPEIMVIYFTGMLLPPDPTDPPPNGSVYHVIINDQDATILSDSFVTADGVLTLADIIDAIALDMVGELPGTFTVTADTDENTITLSDDSYFDTSLAPAFYKDTGSVDHRLRVKITQTYIAGAAGSAGDPQTVVITLGSDDVKPGATYSLVFTGDDGEQHTVEYTALPTDAGQQILLGLIDAITTEMATDDFFDGTTLSLDDTSPSLTIGMRNVFGLDATRRPPPGVYWELVPFPFALVDQVVDGVYSDVLKEQGQNEKAQTEQQNAITDTQVRIGSFGAQQYDPLTDQQKPKSRYSVK